MQFQCKDSYTIIYELVVVSGLVVNKNITDGWVLAATFREESETS